MFSTEIKVLESKQSHCFPWGIWCGLFPYGVWVGTVAFQSLCFGLLSTSKAQGDWLSACLCFLYLQQIQETERLRWEIWNDDLESFDFQEKTDGAHIIAKEDVQMIKDEAPETASQTEEMPSQKGAVLEEFPADSTDHREDKERGRTQAKERGNSWLSPAVSVEELCSKKERKKLIETKILSKIIVQPPPKQDIKPPSHGISNGLGSLAKEETSSAEHLGEVTHLPLQASGPKSFGGCCWWGGGTDSACTVPLQRGAEVPNSHTPQGLCVTQAPKAVPRLPVQVQAMAKAMDQQQGPWNCSGKPTTASVPGKARSFSDSR